MGTEFQLEMMKGFGDRWWCYTTLQMFLIPPKCKLKNGKFYVMCILSEFLGKGGGRGAGAGRLPGGEEGVLSGWWLSLTLMFAVALPGWTR